MYIELLTPIVKKFNKKVKLLAIFLLNTGSSFKILVP